MKKIAALLKSEGFLYIVFGALTTAVNLVTFWLLFDYRGVHETVAVVTAWLISVLFAFVTNKLWVFRSKSFKGKVFLREGASFFGARLATLGVEAAGLWFFVRILKITGVVLSVPLRFAGAAFDFVLSRETLVKTGLNVVVILLNYVFSKLFIFKNSAKERDEAS